MIRLNPVYFIEVHGKDWADWVIFPYNTYYMSSNLASGNPIPPTLAYYIWLTKEVDGGTVCGMVMLALQKAVDTVDREILLIKLRAMGFNNLAVKMG